MPWDDKGEIQFFSVKLYPQLHKTIDGFTQDFPMQGFSEIFSRPQNRPTKSTIGYCNICFRLYRYNEPVKIIY